ncbi:Transposase domain, partial [Thermophagus xiamenensis]
MHFCLCIFIHILLWQKSPSSFHLFREIPKILYFFDGKAIITIFEQTKNPEIRHICLKTGFKILQAVIKVQRIPNFQATLPLFSVEDKFHLLYNQFLQTDLGKIYTAIPWDALVRIFKLQENKKGPASIFSPRGKIALMFLKHYSGCSDKRLIEQFNGNIYYQFFCQTFLEKGEYIKNYKIVSQIRCEISKKLDIKE